MRVRGNTTLERVSFAVLSEIGGDLSVTFNEELAELSLLALETIEGEVTLKNNGSAIDCDLGSYSEEYCH